MYQPMIPRKTWFAIYFALWAAASLVAWFWSPWLGLLAAVPFIAFAMFTNPVPRGGLKADDPRRDVFVPCGCRACGEYGDADGHDD